jgi:hypothetical protein
MPRQVLNALKPRSFDAACRLVLAQVRAGTLISVARRISYRDGAGQLIDLDFRIMSRDHWLDIREDDLSDEYFWDTGTAKTFSDVVREMRSYSLEAQPYESDMVAVDVRFDPAGVRALTPNTRGPMTLTDAIAAGHLNRPLPTLVATQAPTARIGGAPIAAKVPRPALRAWVGQFGARNPDAHFADFLAGARAHFPGLRVAERPVRDEIANLGLTKTRGNPAIKRK